MAQTGDGHRADVDHREYGDHHRDDRTLVDKEFRHSRLPGRDELRNHLGPLTNLLNALGDDMLARLDSVIEDPLMPYPLADGNGTNAHPVIGAHHRDLISALQASETAQSLRDQQRALVRSDRHADLRVLAGPQSCFQGSGIAPPP